MKYNIDICGRLDIMQRLTTLSRWKKQEKRYKNKTDQVLVIQETDPRCEYHGSSELTCLVMKRVTTLGLGLDNVDRAWPKMSIGIELAKKMKWVEWGRFNNGNHGYVLGPNLRKEFLNNEVLRALNVTVDHLFTKRIRMRCT